MALLHKRFDAHSQRVIVGLGSLDDSTGLDEHIVTLLSLGIRISATKLKIIVKNYLLLSIVYYLCNQMLSALIEDNYVGFRLGLDF